jgi:hypothetical protein
MDVHRGDDQLDRLLELGVEGVVVTELEQVEAGQVAGAVVESCTHRRDWTR